MSSCVDMTHPTMHKFSHTHTQNDLSMTGTVHRWINKYKWINWKAVHPPFHQYTYTQTHTHTIHDCDSGMGEGVSVIVL